MPSSSSLEYTVSPHDTSKGISGVFVTMRAKLPTHADKQPVCKIIKAFNISFTLIIPPRFRLAAQRPAHEPLGRLGRLLTTNHCTWIQVCGKHQ